MVDVNRVRRAAAATAWTLVLAATACSDESGGDGSNPMAVTPDLGGVSFVNDGSGTGSGSTGQGTASGSGSTAAFEQCAGQAVSTEVLPTNLYVMFDTSCSMSCPAELAGPGQCCMGDPNPRMDLVRTAVENFLADPNTSGIGVGIGYFGDLPAGMTSCNADDYADADVEVAALPGNMDPIVTSLRAQNPAGETPTGAAIRGACDYAREFRQTRGAGIALLLVTDGVPEAPVTNSCNPTLEDAEQAAANCLSDGIPTYLIGVGANLDNLSRLASAGGTNQAYLVSGTSDVTAEVVSALSTIRESARVACEFSLPSPPGGQALNPAQVNVTYIDTSGQVTVIPGVPSSDACGDGGWYYDDPGDPSSVVLCPTSCDFTTSQLTAGAGRMELQFGCDTVGMIR